MKIISLEKQEFDPIIEAKKAFIHYKTRNPLIILEKLGYTCYSSTIIGITYNTFEVNIDFEKKEVHIANESGQKFKTFCLAHAVGKIIYRNLYNQDLNSYPFNITSENYGLEKEEQIALLKCNMFAALLVIDKDYFLSKYNPLTKYDVKENVIYDFLSEHFEVDINIIKFLKHEYIGD